MSSQAIISNLYNKRSLTMNLKEKTRDIFNPKYKISDQYKFPEKAVYDKSDCGFRKFKTYDEFTKKFDKVPFTSK